MTPKRPNILSRTLGMLIAVAGIGRAASVEHSSTVNFPKNDHSPKPPLSGEGVCISNGTSKIQTVGTGWQQRFYRVKVRAHKSIGIRRCDSEGNFINRKTGERLAA